MPVYLIEIEKAIDGIISSPLQNIDNIFNIIQLFQDLCYMIQNDNMKTQLVMYAYLVFKKTGIFLTGLQKWNVKAQADKTFNNFNFMRHKYLDLQAVGDLTAHSSSLIECKN